MRRLFVILLALILCGCTNEYQELGYSKSETKIINSLDKADQAFFSQNITKFYKEIFDDENFNKDNLKTYLLFENYLPGHDVVGLVNDEIIDIENYGRVKRLAECENFDVNKITDYLRIDVKYSPELVIKIINNNLENDLEFIDELYKDKMFIVDNLDLYIKYKDSKENIRDLIEFVNSKSFLTYYKEQVSAEVDKYDYLTLVNKYHYLEKDYVPNDLVDVEINYGRGQLRKEAYDAYKSMQDDANAQGFSFYITSPFRSYETQERLYNNYLTIDPQQEVDIYSARPGSSEHQLGLALDILKSGYDFDNFYLTPEATWLSENSYKYGFILRYPKDKVEITGYKYEPWHFRYLGKTAEDVYMSGVTYDEYFEKYVK